MINNYLDNNYDIRFEFLCDVCNEPITDLKDGTLATPPTMFRDIGLLTIEDIAFVTDAVTEGRTDAYHVHTEVCWEKLEKAWGAEGGDDTLEHFGDGIQESLKKGILFQSPNSTDNYQESL